MSKLEGEECYRTKLYSFLYTGMNQSCTLYVNWSEKADRGRIRIRLHPWKEAEVAKTKIDSNAEKSEVKNISNRISVKIIGVL